MKSEGGKSADLETRISNSKLEEYASTATQVAREAGQFLKEHLHDRFAVSRKGEIDLVTEFDLAVENLIITRLASTFPESTVLSEETHAEAARSAVTWIIDPLDGTTNFAHGLPIFSVSIGLEIDGALAWGIVYNPNLEEAFVARRGGGAFLNGDPIKVSETKSLGSSLLATGFPYDIRTSAKNNLNYFQAFALRSQGIRRGGSAALAAGRFDGFWEMKLHPWDCAAGYLMVREAGGLVTNWRGEFGSIYERECLASNARIHEPMMAILRETTALDRGTA
jgi:myo-inositol-1(or 4)-monophosphatase